MPACLAASTLATTPPTGFTLPLMDISPVRAISLLTGRLNIAEYIAAAIAMPADGPSMGIPPGKLRWMSYSLASTSRYLFRTVSTFSTEDFAELILFSLCPLPSISSSSTMPVTFIVPFPDGAFIAVTSISMTTPVAFPKTASPFTHPTCFSCADTFFSILGL